MSQTQRPGNIVEGTYDATTWREVGLRLRKTHDHLATTGSRQMWEVGDWIVIGEDVVLKNLKKRKVRQFALELSGYSSHTLSMAASVSRKVKPDIRIDGLSWWHHQAVAKLSQARQTDWLTRAAESDWSVREFRRRLREEGMTTAAPRRMRQERLISELLTFRRDEFDEKLIAKLREWCQSESPGTE